MTIKGSGLFRRSRVTDPQTGEKRRISEDAPVEATASFTHDLPTLHLRWGVNYAFQKVETEFKVGEVQRDRLSDRVDAFVEYKPDARWTIRLFGKNLTDSPADPAPADLHGPAREQRARLSGRARAAERALLRDQRAASLRGMRTRSSFNILKS